MQPPAELFREFGIGDRDRCGRIDGTCETGLYEHMRDQADQVVALDPSRLRVEAVSPSLYRPQHRERLPCPAQLEQIGTAGLILHGVDARR
jgi:hypothetical protein